MTATKTPAPADTDIPYDRSAGAKAGELVRVSPLVRRLIAPNGGPFTFTGTCTYIVGNGAVAVIDPGPDNAGHMAQLLDALRGESVETIVITHTHRDHSPAAAAQKAATGAKIVGCAQHFQAQDLGAGESNMLEGSNDLT